MKRAELLQHARCDVCNKGIGESGLPLFWRVTVERFGVDLRAVRRQDGLGQYLGHHGSAAIMGPDEDMAKPMQDQPGVVTVCETCCTEPVPIALLSEWGQAKIVAAHKATAAHLVKQIRACEGERHSNAERLQDELRRHNNPKGEKTGHHTGRCMYCGSDDLWDDNLAYGCNCCSSLLGTDDAPLLVRTSDGKVLGPVHTRADVDALIEIHREDLTP